METTVIRYSPYYYFGYELVCPTEEYFLTVEDALNYLREDYGDMIQLVGNEDWMGVTKENVDIDEEGDVIGGTILEHVKRPTGRFWYGDFDEVKYKIDT